MHFYFAYRTTQLYLSKTFFFLFCSSCGVLIIFFANNNWVYLWENLVFVTFTHTVSLFVLICKGLLFKRETFVQRVTTIQIQPLIKTTVNVNGLVRCVISEYTLRCSVHSFVPYYGAVSRGAICFSRFYWKCIPHYVRPVQCDQHALCILKTFRYYFALNTFDRRLKNRFFVSKKNLEFKLPYSDV